MPQRLQAAALDADAQTVPFRLDAHPAGGRFGHTEPRLDFLKLQFAGFFKQRGEFDIPLTDLSHSAPYFG